MPPGADKPKCSPPLIAEQQHSDEYEDYDDQYVDTYSSSKTNMLHQKMQDIQLEDDLPDTTMLDSVVLPAIASVSFIPNSAFVVLIRLV
jgi:serine/threonine-protein kinase 24/25/MST4